MGTVSSVWIATIVCLVALASTLPQALSGRSLRGASSRPDAPPLIRRTARQAAIGVSAAVIGVLCVVWSQQYQVLALPGAVLLVAGAAIWIAALVQRRRAARRTR